MGLNGFSKSDTPAPVPSPVITRPSMDLIIKDLPMNLKSIQPNMTTVAQSKTLGVARLWLTSGEQL